MCMRSALDSACWAALGSRRRASRSRGSGLNCSSRLTVTNDMIFSAKVTTSLGTVPIIALFALDDRGNPRSKLIAQNAVEISSLKEWTSITSLSCQLKKGIYLVSYGLKETGSGFLQVKLFGSSMLKLFLRV